MGSYRKHENMKAWSYSSLTKFENCPRAFYLTKVAKVVTEPPTEATDWGKKVHEALEFRVRDKTPLPDWAAQWEPMVSRFDKFGDTVFCELELGLTRNMQQTGFNDADCWYRGIIDVGVHGRTAYLGDYKTGKIKTDNDQLNLFAATYMTIHPSVEKAHTQYLWLKFDKTTGKVITRNELSGIWSEFMHRVNRLEHAYNADKWPAKPSGLCNGWCPAKGHCEFWKPKKPTNK